MIGKHELLILVKKFFKTFVISVIVNFTMLKLIDKILNLTMFTIK